MLKNRNKLLALSLAAASLTWSGCSQWQTKKNDQPQQGQDPQSEESEDLLVAIKVIKEYLFPNEFHKLKKETQRDASGRITSTIQYEYEDDVLRSQTLRSQTHELFANDGSLTSRTTSRFALNKCEDSQTETEAFGTSPRKEIKKISVLCQNKMILKSMEFTQIDGGPETNTKTTEYFYDSQRELIKTETHYQSTSVPTHTIEERSYKTDSSGKIAEETIVKFEDGKPIEKRVQDNASDTMSIYRYSAEKKDFSELYEQTSGIRPEFKSLTSMSALYPGSLDSKGSRKDVNDDIQQECSFDLSGANCSYRKQSNSSADYSFNTTTQYRMIPIFVEDPSFLKSSFFKDYLVGAKLRLTYVRQQSSTTSKIMSRGIETLSHTSEQGEFNQFGYPVKTVSNHLKVQFSLPSP